MAIKINSGKAKEKINKFIDEVDTLLKLTYDEGEPKRTQLDVSITNFAKAFFSDGEAKLKSYTPMYFGFLGYEETQAEKQQEYLEDLNRMKNHLMAWKEEVELTEELTEDSKKLTSLGKSIPKAISKLKDIETKSLNKDNVDTKPTNTKLKAQLEKASLEAQRREEVARSKFYGGVIELLDIQRNHIKEKEKTTQAIINIQKDIADIKSIVKRIEKARSSKRQTDISQS